MAEYTASPLPENAFPIAWTLSPVYTAADGNVTGGVIRTEICSLVSGHLSPAQYEPVTDRTETGISLLRRSRCFLPTIRMRSSPVCPAVMVTGRCAPWC